MTPRWLLAALVLALPICVTTLAVVMAGYALVQALGDQMGARALLCVAMGTLVLLLIDVVLLVAVLGMRAVAEPPDDDRGESNRGER